MPNLLQTSIDEAIRTFESLRAMDGPVQRAADLLREAMISGHKLLACGNGGSAADAAHMTTEFVCRLNRDRRPYPAICLATHGGDLTAIGNDYDFRDLFARQVQAFGQKGDVLIALTTSGQSENIRRALVAAGERGVGTIALLGKDGGVCKGLADAEMIVPGTDTARIQEGHKLLIHTICNLVEPALAAK